MSETENNKRTGIIRLNEKLTAALNSALSVTTSAWVYNRKIQAITLTMIGGELSIYTHDPFVFGRLLIDIVPDTPLNAPSKYTFALYEAACYARYIVDKFVHDNEPKQQEQNK